MSTKQIARRSHLRQQIHMILSHHENEELERGCIRIQVGQSVLHFCARCSGAFLGLLTGLILIRMGMMSDSVYLFPLILFAVLPGAFDGLLGYVGLRSSARHVRFASGLLLGLGMSFILVLSPFPRLLLAVMIVSGLLLLITFEERVRQLLRWVVRSGQG